MESQCQQAQRRRHQPQAACTQSPSCSPLVVWSDCPQRLRGQLVLGLSSCRRPTRTSSARARRRVQLVHFFHRPSSPKTHPRRVADEPAQTGTRTSAQQPAPPRRRGSPARRRRRLASMPSPIIELGPSRRAHVAAHQTCLAAVSAAFLVSASPALPSRRESKCSRWTRSPAALVVLRPALPPWVSVARWTGAATAMGWAIIATRVMVAAPVTAAAVLRGRGICERPPEMVKAAPNGDAKGNLRPGKGIRA